jgi:hypothetical protein
MNLIMEELPCLTLDIPTPATPILVGHPIWGHRVPSTSSREVVPAQCGPGWSSLSSPSSWFSGWRSSITAPTRRVTSLAHPPRRDLRLPSHGPQLPRIPGVMHRSRRLPHPPRHRSRADERSCMTVPERRSSRFGVRVFFEEVERTRVHHGRSTKRAPTGKDAPPQNAKTSIAKMKVLTPANCRASVPASPLSYP